MGLENQMWWKRSCCTSHLTRVQAKEGVQGWRGLIQLSGVPRTPSPPPGRTLGFGICHPTENPEWQSSLCQWDEQSLPVHEFRLCCSHPAAQSPWVSNVPQWGTNLGVQMYLFNPRLRHLTAALIQHLCHRARSAVFQTFNFLWNRCEKQRENSDPGFCFTIRTEAVSHRSFPPVTLMFIFLPAHLDLTNSSCFSSWHHISLRDASYGNCTELPRRAGNQFFTPPNSSPQIQDEKYDLSPFLSYVVFFPFVPLIYISHVLTNASGAFPR